MYAGKPRLVASVAQRRAADLPADITARVAPADLVEVRLDAPAPGDLEEGQRLVEAAAGWGRPLIVTPRSPVEGGLQRWSDPDRQALLERIWELPGVHYADLELLSSRQLLEWGLAEGPAGLHWIASYHELEGLPSEGELDTLAGDAHHLGAHLFKIAARTDLPGSAQLACWCRRQSQATIALPMGEEAGAGRAFGGVFGSWATYGHVGEATAPGQWPVAELRDLLDRLHG